ncbi:barstar family protein [Varunaivibrio sulfuroxidans]|uniref:Barstar (Barnase inhibitor) n=1 Tax=Varunaivibrio sulfuroxidans TaxID=1773489 RepID=A0A4R3J8I9_9PROT|nr:barstar family protein [Varunaivibrio sulfuroxidans]TCS61794.1 barstar (barnase inhibitor) [Varunaivibrio sulfuroxidans]WES32023.1 barstar family protein [Varunaivibrio sulfuroxidans]
MAPDSTTKFEYGNYSISANDLDSCIATLPIGLVGQEQLLYALYEVLNFPGWFGFNWNALYDCLRDFSWIEKNKIILIHKEFPKLSNKDMKIYLDILSNSINDWRSDDKHEFKVIFPVHTRNNIEAIWNKS